MRITKIEIQNYKSIKELVEINFYNGLPTVLIGKNGSGKTNILEALNAVVEANSVHFGVQKEPPLSYKVHILLEKEDIEKLFPDKNIDEKKCEFIACSGEKFKIDRIESEYLVSLLKSEVCEVSDLANELKDALDTYQKQLHKIAYSENKEQPLRGYRIIDSRGSMTNYDALKFQVNFVLEQAERLADAIRKSFCVEECSFKFGYVYNYFLPNNLDRLRFSLCYVKPDLAPFEEKFITVNEPALKREITRINKVTKASCDKITVLLHELNERIKRLNAALKDDQMMNDHSGGLYQFISEIQQCVSAKCIFLRNESSETIFKTEDPRHEYLRGDKSHLILQTYWNKVYKGTDKDQIQKQINEDKEFSLPEAAWNAFEKYLNANIPVFEGGMYDRISVERSDGKLLSIRLHEKTGETVTLDSTSAGRRWYFTYYFMKNTLESGDLFIIDEPAAMLHPLAQKEVLNELCELKSRGINVVYSTHSPYLIPNDWESVHFVTMTNSGTTLTQENKYDLLKQVTGGDIFDLQEVLDQYQRSDKESIAHRCYHAVLDSFGDINEAAKQLNFSAATINSWKKCIKSKKFRSPKLESIILIAEKTGRNITDLL